MGINEETRGKYTGLADRVIRTFFTRLVSLFSVPCFPDLGEQRGSYPLPLELGART
jgi:hypothetical protein